MSNWVLRPGLWHPHIGIENTDWYVLVIDEFVDGEDTVSSVGCDCLTSAAHDCDSTLDVGHVH